MKKLPSIILALLLSINLVACDENEGSTDLSYVASELKTSEVTLISKEGNFTTLLVPSNFSEFKDVDGFAVAETAGASIVVSPTFEMDVNIEDITEDYMISLVEDTYSNINVLEFDNTATIAGTDAVYFRFTGDGKSNNKSKTVCYLSLFFSVDDQPCEQQVVFTFETGANTSLEANLSDIISSISL